MGCCTYGGCLAHPSTLPPWRRWLLGAHGVFRWSVSLLTWLVDTYLALSARRCSNLSSPDGLMACNLPHGHSPSMACMGASRVDSHYLGGGCLSRQLWALPSSMVILLIGLKSDTQLGWCQYVVFIIKLILSYCPVYLTTPSRPPLSGKVMCILT